MCLVFELTSREVLPVFTPMALLAEYFQILRAVVPAIPYANTVMDMQMSVRETPLARARRRSCGLLALVPVGRIFRPEVPQFPEPAPVQLDIMLKSLYFQICLRDFLPVPRDVNRIAAKESSYLVP